MLPIGLKYTFSFQVQLNADMNIELYVVFAVHLYVSYVIRSVHYL